MGSRLILISQISRYPILHAPMFCHLPQGFQNSFCFRCTTFPSHVGTFGIKESSYRLFTSLRQTSRRGQIFSLDDVDSIWQYSEPELLGSFVTCAWLLNFREPERIREWFEMRGDSFHEVKTQAIWCPFLRSSGDFLAFAFVTLRDECLDSNYKQQDNCVD